MTNEEDSKARIERVEWRIDELESRVDIRLAELEGRLDENLQALSRLLFVTNSLLDMVKQLAGRRP